MLDRLLCATFPVPWSSMIVHYSHDINFAVGYAIYNGIWKLSEHEASEAQLEFWPGVRELLNGSYADSSSAR